MKERIQQHNDREEIFTSERCYITELSNTPDDPEVSIARARVEPGVTTCWHRLRGIAERYCIINGTGRVEIGNLPPRDVHPGDMVLIPPLCRQRISNVGQDDLLFLAICTPRFCIDAYEDIESTMNNKIKK
jgi:mannose-6-phosphate isomerase-like protein (cupin superfamily)